jgi:hypothetical protein
VGGGGRGEWQTWGVEVGGRGHEGESRVATSAIGGSRRGEADQRSGGVGTGGVETGD